MTSQKEQFYIQHIATLEKQVAELLKINETLVKKNSELTEQVKKLTDKVAKLSTKHQNSSEGKHRQWRSFAEGCSCKLMERTLELNRKWTPEGTNAPCDIDNFECDDDEDFDELDIDNWIEDDDDDSGDFGFGEETHKKYEIIIANKKEKIDEYIDQMEVEEESLSTSANMDHSSFQSGTIAAEGISLKVHKLVGKG